MYRMYKYCERMEVQEQPTGAAGSRWRTAQAVNEPLE
jgi:hypothetical protein